MKLYQEPDIPGSERVTTSSSKLHMDIKETKHGPIEIFFGPFSMSHKFKVGERKCVKLIDKERQEFDPSTHNKALHLYTLGHP